jgi:enoyl-CoA hydratase/carnithine racemase
VADLEFTVTEGIGTILLNRPDRANAFTLEMVDQWAQILRDVRDDDAVRVIVVTGAGKAFCAGGELDVLDDDERTPLALKEVLRQRVHRVALALEDLDKPVIAAVNGAAVGAGMDMALMCDIRIVGESARFSEGYIKVGLLPGDGGCYYLPRLVGMGMALELLWTGDFMNAQQAVNLGLANHVYPDEELLEQTLRLARRIAAAPQANIRMIKRASYQSAQSDLRTALDLISSHMAVVQNTPESREAMRVFREKQLARSQAQ